MNITTVLRVARPTDHMEEVVRFYTEGLDNLLVFYFPDAVEWQAAIDRTLKAGYDPVRSFNPYWDRAGRTFEDPDGYRVVFQNAAWPA